VDWTLARMGIARNAYRILVSKSSGENFTSKLEKEMGNFLTS
jgi:hypothetical protein